MIALGRALAARGHAVTLQTAERWGHDVRAEGLRFEPAPEYQVFPTRERPLKPYQAVVRAAAACAPLLDAVRPDVVVADVLTLAPALAAEMRGVPLATVIPHVYPVGAPGLPPYSFGARLSRWPVAPWSLLQRPLDAALARGRDELNETRRRLGLPALSHFHGGLSRDLCLVGTLPALEYPRDWPPWVRVVGPLMWEPPARREAPPPGDGPAVMVAPSTAQDPGQRMLLTALRGLAGAPVRVLATWNRRPPPRPPAVPANARLVEWLSYARSMPACDVVVCHGGHGTVVRAVSAGCRIVAVPAGGDMYENAARIDWAGLGVRLPMRLLSPATLRLAVERALRRPEAPGRAAAAWIAERDPAMRAAELLERLAARR